MGNQSNVNVGLTGGTLNFKQSAWFNSGNQYTTLAQGTGQVNVSNILYANGRVVAGGGTLAVNYGSLGSNHQGQLQDGSYPGWYATNAGVLTLPAVTVHNNNLAYWGEVPGYNGDVPNVNSLVNSIQFSNWTYSGATSTVR